MTHSTQKRLTVDISRKAHRQLKGACADQGMTMREFVIVAIYRQLEELEEEHDLIVSEDVMRRIKSGEEELIDWSAMEKRLGWDAL